MMALACADHKRLDILRPLEDIIVPRGSVAIFRSKVIGYPRARATWYKDGSLVVPSPRMNYSAERNNYQLEIRDVTDADHGLYTVRFENVNDHLMSKGRLFLSPNRPHASALYIVPPPRRALHFRQVFPIMIRRGQDLHIEPLFRVRTLEFSWYRNNQLLTNTGRYLINNSLIASSLRINLSHPTDTGIYTLVNRTQFGFISVIMDVFVVDCIPLNYVVPKIDEPLPEEVEFYLGDEVNLILRVSINRNTLIDWYRRGKEIREDEAIREFYGDGYIGLRIPEASQEVADQYTVVLTNVCTRHVATVDSHCFLTLNEMEIPEIQPPVELKKHLQSVLTCIGAKVIFHCNFEIRDSKYFYVVWKISRHSVECASSKFQILSKGGDFILYIPSVEISMAGAVVCELRKMVPHRKSVVVAQACAHLAILPPNHLEYQLHIEKRAYRNNLFVAGSQPSDEENNNLQFPVRRPLKLQRPDSRILSIIYCRFNDGHFYMLVSVNEEPVYNNLRVLEARASELQNAYHTLIEWDYSVYPVSGAFMVELGDSMDNFVDVGTTTVPRVEFRDLPVGTIIKTKIRSIGPIEGHVTCKLYLNIHLREPISLLRRHDFGTHAEFAEKYTQLDTLIGTGAFGDVHLVKSSESMFAAKIIKTTQRKKAETAVREFNMMKKLCHPHLCSAVEAYQDASSVVIVMEYLWGGELFERIAEEGEAKEIDVIPYIRQICDGLNYMHCRQVLHLDIKPENIVCVSPNSNAIKIIDFGLARTLVDGEMTKVVYGTKDYIAPEVLNFEGLTPASDMWSLGVVTYVLLTGVMPFAGETWPERLNNILGAKYNYNDIAVWEISRAARNFVDSLLVLEPRARLSATEALEHAWLVGGPSPEECATEMKISRQNLKNYVEASKASRRWQRVGQVMIAAHRLRTQVTNMPGPSSQTP